MRSAQCGASWSRRARWQRPLPRRRPQLEQARLEIVRRRLRLAYANVVVEAIVENLDVKRALFRELDEIVAPTACWRNNLVAVGDGDRRRHEVPRRVAGFHFFNPVPLMKVVEVVAGALTDEASLELLTALAREWGHAGARAGHAGLHRQSRQGPQVRHKALAILRECVAEVPVIDAILRDAAGFGSGPFELLDLTALDVSHPVMESIYRQYYDDPRYRPIADRRAAARRRPARRKSGAASIATTVRRIRKRRSLALRRGPGRSGSAMPIRRPRSRCGICLQRLGDGRNRTRARGRSADRRHAARQRRQCLHRRRASRRQTTIGIDTLLDLGKRRTLMRSPATDSGIAAQAQALFAQDGVPASLIADSAGFVAQRCCHHRQHRLRIIVQQGVCAALSTWIAQSSSASAYPRPLAWGDALGPGGPPYPCQPAGTGDMRYRPSLWLRQPRRTGTVAAAAPIDIVASASCHDVSSGRSCTAELAAHDDLHAVALRIRLARKVHREVDGAHDAVAELLVDECLEGRSVNVDQFVEAIDQRVGRNDVGSDPLGND